MKKFFCFFYFISFAIVVSAVSKRYSLWYDTPAFNRGASYDINFAGGFPFDEDWEHWSLPIGNGYMGANIFGRTDIERIQISEKTLSNKGCYGVGGFTNFMELYLDFFHNNFQGYKRELSLNDAIATVTYKHNGIVYTREYFANYPSNVIAIKLKSNVPGGLNFTVRPQIPYCNSLRLGDSRTGEIIVNKDIIRLFGFMEFFGQRYEGQIKVLNYGGNIQAFNDDYCKKAGIHVNKADSVEIFIAAATSYQLREDVFIAPHLEKCLGNPSPENIVTDRIEKAISKGYNELKKEHLFDYKYFFDRVNLELCSGTPEITTDELLYRYRDGKFDLYLEELFFQYGRYLLISSSREGSLPANLQGAWTQYEYTPWTGGYWHNINVQMNYWPVFNTNLTELFVPFVQYNNAYRKKAIEHAVQYISENNPAALSPIKEENGWAVGTGGTPFFIGMPGGHSGPGTGGFTTKMFWDYYDFTRDEKVLKECVYPVLSGMTNFLSKVLVKDSLGNMLASPSYSPEQKHRGKHYKTLGCTFDQGMIWENFNDYLKASDILNIKGKLYVQVKNMIRKLDPVLIGDSGQLKEYREEGKYGEIGDPHHRHISHLCTVYPGTLVNIDTPLWFEAAKKTLKFRGNKGYGWPMAHRMNVWARLKDGDNAYEALQILLKGAMENLWGRGRPFQIDANLGVTAGIAEMLLQSHEGFISLLPALPESWKTGAYSGLVARGNFEISVKWKNNNAYEIIIHSRSGGKCLLRYKNISDFIIQSNDLIKVVNKDCIEINTLRNHKYCLVKL